MTEAGNNYSEKKTQLHISVRNLVEFIFREGDIDNRSSRAMSADAMMEGTRIHRKIQGSMGKEYQAEVPLSLVVEGDLYELTVEGRADGIFTEDGKCFVDEIKGMYRKVELFEKPVFVHRAQAMCYAYIFALQNNMETIGIQMTYCNLETEQTKYFREEFSFEEIKKWFDDLMEEYGKWATFQCEMKNQRQASIKELDFPFRRIGSLVVCRDEADMPNLKALYDRGVANGVPGLRILSKEEVHEMEPNLEDDICAALYAPSAGIVCPFNLNIALAENANVNGVEFKFDTEVTLSLIHI